jgi:hypothetical protein
MSFMRERSLIAVLLAWHAAARSERLNDTLNFSQEGPTCLACLK